MIYAEVILIALGMACEVFAWVSCKSASYSRIEPKKYLTFSIIFGIWELIPVLLGYYIFHVLKLVGVSFDDSDTTLFVSALILAVYGLRLLWIGVKNERIEERRKEMEAMTTIMYESVFVGARNFLIGFILYVCRISLAQGVAILTVIAILAAVLGILSGYHYGIAFKRKAYFAGGALLLLSAIGIYLI